MPNTWRVPDDVEPICPDCEGDLTFVCSWPSRGAWGYDEVRTYECPTHGPIFITSEISVGAEPSSAQDKAPDEGDRDFLIPARRKPTPVLNADAIAVPEPEPEPDSN
jgi:hypothetical protein